MGTEKQSKPSQTPGVFPKKVKRLTWFLIRLCENNTAKHTHKFPEAPAHRCSMKMML